MRARVLTRFIYQQLPSFLIHHFNLNRELSVTLINQSVCRIEVPLWRIIGTM